MKTRHKLRQRLLALDFQSVLHPVTEDRARAGFDQIRQAVESSGLQAGNPDTRRQ